MRNLFSDRSRISPRWGRQPSGEPTYNFAKLFQKPHEIERIGTRGEGARIPCARLDLPTNSIIHKAASPTAPGCSMALTGTIPVEQKNVHWSANSLVNIAIHKPTSHGFGTVRYRTSYTYRSCPIASLMIKIIQMYLLHPLVGIQ